MSHQDAIEPVCSERSDQINLLVTPKSKDLGGFSVKRVLPASKARSIGPFVFFDEMGPAQFPPGEGINVRPHPHIGLSTVTFLFEGEILHRDSLGYVQPIQPGAVNLMTAGKGIVHSERTSEERLANGQALHGIQVWMALPEDSQEIDPAFVHYPRQELPVITSDGVQTTVIIGAFENHTSPVTVLPQTLYLEQQITSGNTSVLTPVVEQRAIYVVEGKVSIGSCEIESGTMAVLKSGEDVSVLAQEDSRIMVIGGESFSPRHMFWNFVHASPERIEEAKQAWKNDEFEKVPGDEEFIPLPE